MDEKQSAQPSKCSTTDQTSLFIPPLLDMFRLVLCFLGDLETVLALRGTNRALNQLCQEQLLQRAKTRPSMTVRMRGARLADSLVDLTIRLGWSDDKFLSRHNLVQDIIQRRPVSTKLPQQAYLERARQLLDERGWVHGNDFKNSEGSPVNAADDAHFQARARLTDKDGLDDWGWSVEMNFNSKLSRQDAWKLVQDMLQRWQDTAVEYATTAVSVHQKQELRLQWFSLIINAQEIRHGYQCWREDKPDYYNQVREWGILLVTCDGTKVELIATEKHRPYPYFSRV